MITRGRATTQKTMTTCSSGSPSLLTTTCCWRRYRPGRLGKALRDLAPAIPPMRRGSSPCAEVAWNHVAPSPHQHAYRIVFAAGRQVTLRALWWGDAFAFDIASAVWGTRGLESP